MEAEAVFVCLCTRMNISHFMNEYAVMHTCAHNDYKCADTCKSMHAGINQNETCMCHKIYLTSFFFEKAFCLELDTED